MKKYLPMLLVIFIKFILCNNLVFADLANQCLLEVSPNDKLSENKNVDFLSLYIQSDKVSINYHDHNIFFIGNVNIKYGNSTLYADKVQLKQNYKQNNKILLRTIKAIGNVNYCNNEIKLQGLKALSNLNTKDMNIYQGNYQMLHTQGRGTADVIKQRKNNRYTILENGTFTSCLSEENNWSILGSKIIYDHKDQIAEIWHARFKIGKLPVLYSPYLQIPTGSNNRSGFLVPNAKYSSNNGLEFNIPYYVSLAPNYDTTITSNYISKRGNKIQTEFRYLVAPGEGVIEFHWLPKDHVYLYENTNNYDKNRWLLYWYHSGLINKVWHFNVDYTKVKDYNYFDNLYSRHANTTNNYNTQKFSLAYTSKHWDAIISHKQFQDLYNKKSSAYRASPQLNINYYTDDARLFNFKLFSQLTKFININNNYPTTTRLHIEPILNISPINNWGNLNTELKIMATHYMQEKIVEYNKNIDNHLHLNSSVNRILPQFKTNGSIIFERNLINLPKYTQTLEPRFQYLYIPYHNQSNIGIYDSTVLQTDYSYLFRDRAYSGLDRISSANTLTCELVTRIYNDQSLEKFSASLSHIYHFSKPRSTSSNINWNNRNNISNIVWATNGHWRVNSQHGIRGSLQYDPKLNGIVLGNAILEYRSDENHIFQLNYRYTNDKYIKHILPNINYFNHQQGISQFGIIGSWPILTRLALIGAYYYNTKTNHTADQLLGLQYNNCCWAMNLGYERKVISWDDINNSSQYDNKISFNIELRGLSKNFNSNPDKILTSSIIPYQHIF